MALYNSEHLEITAQLTAAITMASNHRNQMPLHHVPGAAVFCGPDVTTFLHKYESLAAFTAAEVTENSIIAMFPYYCTEGSLRETVMMMRGYTNRDWAALKQEMLDVFRYSDSRPNSFVYTCQYLEQLCATFRDSHSGHDHAEFGGLDQTESLKSFLRTYDHISGIVSERAMMCEYERTEMLLRALSKRLWRKAVTKLGMHPLEPGTFEYDKLKYWISAKISTAEALAMFEFLAPAAALPTTSASPPTLTTSPAPMTPTTLTAPTALVTPMAPMISTTVHLSPAATDMTPATLSAPMASATPIASSSPGAVTDTTPATPTAPKAPAAPITPTSSGTASPKTLMVPTA